MKSILISLKLLGIIGVVLFVVFYGCLMDSPVNSSKTRQENPVDFEPECLGAENSKIVISMRQNLTGLSGWVSLKVIETPAGFNYVMKAVGQLLDSGSGTPVQGMEMYLMLDGAILDTVETNKNGKFSLTSAGTLESFDPEYFSWAVQSYEALYGAVPICWRVYCFDPDVPGRCCEWVYSEPTGEAKAYLEVYIYKCGDGSILKEYVGPCGGGSIPPVEP